jgi:hypothetical protein
MKILLQLVVAFIGMVLVMEQHFGILFDVLFMGMFLCYCLYLTIKAEKKRYEDGRF